MVSVVAWEKRGGMSGNDGPCLRHVSRRVETNLSRSGEDVVSVVAGDQHIRQVRVIETHQQ